MTAAMAVREIVRHGDPALRGNVRKIDEITDEIRTLIDDLIEKRLNYRFNHGTFGIRIFGYSVNNFFFRNCRHRSPPE